MTTIETREQASASEPIGPWVSLGTAAACGDTTIGCIESSGKLLSVSLRPNTGFRRCARAQSSDGCEEGAYHDVFSQSAEKQVDDDDI
jgi:hypothetical protein